jgi:polyisoprenoid-binding protein YceI
MNLPGICRVAALAACLSAAMTGRGAAHGADYSVDPVHSTVLFRVKHMETSYTFGRFNGVSGRFAAGDGGSIDVAIKTATVDTGNPKRDQHLRGVDFFNTVQFPEIRFKSKRLARSSSDPEALDVTGELTLHGVTRPISVRLERTGTGSMRGVSIAGLYGEFTVKRSDYGMKGMTGAVGDEVRITVSLEGAAR